MIYACRPGAVLLDHIEGSDVGRRAGRQINCSCVAFKLWGSRVGKHVQWMFGERRIQPTQIFRQQLETM